MVNGGFHIAKIEIIDELAIFFSNNFGFRKVLIALHAFEKALLYFLIFYCYESHHPNVY